MQISEYLEQASRTDADTAGKAEAIARGNTLFLHDFSHSCMGMVTEAGELMDILKKHINYGKDLDIDHVVEELGDLLWYIALIVNALNRNYGVEFGQILEQNIEKLKLRYPEKFTCEDAMERKDKREV